MFMAAEKMTGIARAAATCGNETLFRFVSLALGFLAPTIPVLSRKVLAGYIPAR